MKLSFACADNIVEHLSWSNLSIDATGHLISTLIENQLPPKLWIITPSESDTSEWIEVLRFWSNESVPILHYPADDPDTLNGISPARIVPQQRLLTLHQWYSPDPCIVVASVFGTIHKNIGLTDLNECTLELTVNAEYDPYELSIHLQQMGYLPTRELDAPGMFRLAGDNIHIWCVGHTESVRLSFFDTELEHIHRFVDGVRLEEHSLSVVQAREMVLSNPRMSRLKGQLAKFVRSNKRGRELFRQVSTNLQDGLWFPGAEDYLPHAFKLESPVLNTQSSQIICVEPNKCLEVIGEWHSRIQNRWRLLNPEQTPLVNKGARYTPLEDFQTIVEHCRQVHSDSLDSGYRAPIQSVQDLQTSQHNLEPLLQKLTRWIHRDFRIVLVARTHNRIHRLSAMLQSHDFQHSSVERIQDGEPGTVSLCIGNVQQGWLDEQGGWVVLSVEYLLNMGVTTRQRIPTTLKEAVISNISEIQSGDLVVHRENGIGQFIGIAQKEFQGSFIDCIQIEYANRVFYYMPVDKIESLYRYRSMGANAKLDKLGSPSWEKRFKKVRNGVGALAEELIKQMASRANQKGHCYQGVPQLLNDFCLSFPYRETPDQQQAIDDVLSDLASDSPMNRLVIGDVGFGKTEVAMRAAIRVVAEGHQVALLCPTTILAIQHHRTFVERCIDFGIRVALLTRLQTAATKKKSFKKFQNDEIDILIGTHAILGKDLRFMRLGLVIVDEEHRFGVKQKESLQRLSQLNPEGPTEYMAMSATPIPRTLHLAMSGLREVSVIATPPPGRIAIQTRFIRFNLDDIAKQIRFELQRGGQVFFVHNVVRELLSIADQLQSLLPNIQIEVASGQHNKKHLEKVMMNIWEGKTQVLVCTTIIENGIDLPNVNTIFINDAYKMGLAQLYQLRGRVGRGKEQAYCTLIIPKDGLNSDALSRMTALKEYSALGSGFAIANADLEIRGSGDLLGKDQSGHIDAIGLDIYIDLLQEAIQDLKSITKISYVPQVTIPVTAVIPVEYIADLQDRLQSYRKLAIANHPDDLQSLLDLWEHTFGPVPVMALNAVGLAEIRLVAKQLGIERVDWLKSRLRLISHPSSDLDWKKVELLCSTNPRLEFVYLQNNLWKLLVKFSYEENKNPIPYVLHVLSLIHSIKTP